MKLLLIEDNQKASAWVRKGLEEAGYIVDYAADGRDGLHLGLSHPYSLVILDIMLPGMDGWQVRKTRRTASQIRVICPPARGSVDDRVKGLEWGANDYLVKPFSFAELLARVRNQLRQQQPHSSVLRVGDLVLDSARFQVVRDGVTLTLTRKEFMLLWLLASRHGEILPRTLLASEIWGVNFDSETNIVDVAIRRLRRKVDDPFPQKLITTVRGMGYCLSEKGGEGD
ncbi:unnamed protein product [Penicillium salamii]|nr:unnamed protein product [Penicillium salamii]